MSIYRKRGEPITKKWFLKQLDRTGKCWLWAKASNSKGYGHLKVNGKTPYAHRIAYELFKGPIPEGLQVLHTCDVGLCCRPAHLFTGTNLENVQGMIKRGRWSSGRRRTPKEVRAIRLDPRLPRVIAQDHGMSLSAVYDIRLRNTYAGVLDD